MTIKTLFHGLPHKRRAIKFSVDSGFGTCAIDDSNSYCN